LFADGLGLKDEMVSLVGVIEVEEWTGLTGDDWRAAVGVDASAETNGGKLACLSIKVCPQPTTRTCHRGCKSSYALGATHFK
jgi:hypothetical protein